MRSATLRHIAVIAALAGMLLAGGCTDQPRQPSEVELQAKAILGATFGGNTDDWFAVQNYGGKLRLVQLHHPASSLSRQSVTETEQMNGLTERANLTVNCRQIRWYDGAWSEWQPGSGSNGLLSGLMPGLLADWGTRLEKKNGQWTFRHSAGHDFQRDRASLARMMHQAGL